MPSGPAKSTRVAIVGASSLRGKELKLVLEERNFPASDIVLLDEPALAGTLTEAGGEPTFIRALSEDSFEDARFVFFAGSQQDAVRNWPAAQSSGATVIDLSGALAASGESTSWIPLLDTVLLPRPGLNAAKSTTNGGASARKSVAYSSPGSGVIIACTLAAALSKLSPSRAVLLLFPPVSERDQAGVDELEAQTANLLSFRPIVQPIFDAQVAFNLLAGYGPECKPTFAKCATQSRRTSRNISRAARRPGHSIGAGAGLLRIRVHRLCGICRCAAARATPDRFQQSRCEGRRAGRSRANQRHRRRRKRNSSGAHRAGPECRGRRVDLGQSPIICAWRW